MIIEVCANSYESAINAEQGGADRIELCKDLHLDGLTPDYKVAKKVINILKIPVFILIRPRAGDFIYSNGEFELMKSDIIKFKEMGCKGIVSGVLNNNNAIDLEKTRELIELSKPIEFTFHRAFDKIDNPIDGINQLISLGANRILTSGKKETANIGLNLIKRLIKISANRIKVMPGGGVTINNIRNFINTGINEIHGSFSNKGITSVDNLKEVKKFLSS